MQPSKSKANLASTFFSLQADMHMYCSIVKIAKVRKSDEGTYEVVAKNREGEAANTLVLNVTDRKTATGAAERKDAPPVVVKPLTPTMCKVRCCATFFSL